MTATASVSFGWIVQPAVWVDPMGRDRSSHEAAASLVVANEECIEAAISFGFDAIWVEDHLGSDSKAHLECLTTIAWLAGRHEGPLWGTMVCAQAFRHPTYLAKAAANMQLLTGGRFILGIGAGNNQAEHVSYGYDFDPPRLRASKTEEAICAIQALWANLPASFGGTHYHASGAYASPIPKPAIPLMIGAGGPMHMLKLVAKYADWWCSDVDTVEAFRQKNAVLTEHCLSCLRDPSEILRSQVVWISFQESERLKREARHPYIVAGTPDEVTEDLLSFRESGVEHFHVRLIDFPQLEGLYRFAAEVLPQVVATGKV